MVSRNHTAYTANGTPYYTEASMVIECKIMYAAPFDPQYYASKSSSAFKKQKWRSSQIATLLGIIVT